jgi:hypothetical protein
MYKKITVKIKREYVLCLKIFHLKNYFVYIVTHSIVFETLGMLAHLKT